MKYFELWKAHLKLRVSKELAYRKDFAMRIIALVLFDIMAPIFALIIYTVSSGIPGWEFSEFILFTGTWTLVLGLDHFLFEALPWKVSWEVQEGIFDRTLLRPGNALFFELTQSTEPKGLASVFVGLAIVVFSVIKYNMLVTSLSIALYLIIIFFALLFLLSLNILTSAVTFVVIKSYTAVDLFHHLREGGRYPITIFGTTGMFILTFILPFGLAAFYPASALLGRLDLINVLTVCMSSVVFFLVSKLAWDISIKYYSSAGG